MDGVPVGRDRPVIGAIRPTRRKDIIDRQAGAVGHFDQRRIVRMPEHGIIRPLVEIARGPAVIERISGIGHIGGDDFNAPHIFVDVFVDERARRYAPDDALFVRRNGGNIAHASAFGIVCLDKRNVLQRNGGMRLIDIPAAHVIVADLINCSRAPRARVIRRTVVRTVVRRARRACGQCGDGKHRTQHECQ